MSAFGQTLLVLALQIGLIAGVGLLVSRRRSPTAAGGPLVLAAVLALLVTPIAFLPRPTRSGPPPLPSAVAESAAVRSDQAETAGGLGIDVLEILRQLQKAPANDVSPSRSTWVYWGWAVLGLSAWGMMRFLRGWRQVRFVCRNAISIEDQALVSLCDELRRSYGCRSVALHETTELCGAATVGWWRPVVLLGRDWRDWTAVQRRAVLAHELAHVVRRDYLTRLIVSFVSALHAYHPLLQRLRSQLEWRQELAADALAADRTGGPRVYAQALAVLALTADTRRMRPAPSFFSRPQTLIRRIGMLRVMDDGNVRTTRKWPGLLVVGLVGIAALALHGTTPEIWADPIVKVAAREPKSPPLDYRYLHSGGKQKHEVGFCLVRLGELSTMPGADKYAVAFGEAMKATAGKISLPCDLKDIEQVGGRVNVSHHPENPAPNRSLSISLIFIRTARDVDWPKYLMGLCPDLKEHRHADTRYYEGGLNLPLISSPIERSTCFYTPDARTLVIESAEVIKSMIDATSKPQPKPEWAEQWQQVENSMFVMVLPEPNKKLAKLLTPAKEAKGTDQQAVAIYGSIVNKSSHTIIAVDSGEQCRLSLNFTCATADDAISVDKDCQKLMTMLEEEWKATGDLAKKLPVTGIIRRGVHFGKNAEHCVGLDMTMKGTLSDLLKSAME